MDQTKWKSVLVPIEVYREIRERSKREGRTISSELRLIYAEATIGSDFINREKVRKKTSIGQSVRSRPANKQKKRSFKRYRGQGK